MVGSKTTPVPVSSAAYRPVIERAPGAYTSLLAAAEWTWSPAPVEVAIVGDGDHPDTRKLLAVVRGRAGLRAIVQHAERETEGGGLPLLAGKRPLDGRPTAWVCREYACRRPTTDPGELAAQLEAAR